MHIIGRTSGMKQFGIFSVIGCCGANKSLLAKGQINLYRPIKITQPGFKIAETTSKNKDTQSRKFERQAEQRWGMLRWERKNTHCTVGENRIKGIGENIHFLKVKSQNVPFEFSTDYLHFILKKATRAFGEVQRRNRKIEELTMSCKS